MTEDEWVAHLKRSGDPSNELFISVLNILREIERINVVPEPEQWTAVRAACRVILEQTEPT